MGIGIRKDIETNKKCYCWNIKKYLVLIDIVLVVSNSQVFGAG